MHKRIYIDTNVIIDLFDKKRPFHKHSLEVIKNLFANEEIEVFINTDTISNLFYILRSYIKLSFDDSIEKLEYVKDSFSVVCSEPIDIDSAIEICKEHIFNDYEDAMQYICALKAKCSLIITNNPKDFRNASIDVITSKKFNKSDIMK
jgi:predicted nucleic acid-binding protein